jgi:hypothetical protein
MMSASLHLLLRGAAGIALALGWSHVRREFIRLTKAGTGPIAEEALRRITRRLVARLLQGILQLAPLVAAFPPLLRDGGERRLHAQRLEPAEHLRRLGTVDPHAAEADAAGGRQRVNAPVQTQLCVVWPAPEWRPAACARIAPAEQARQQDPRGSAAQVALAVGGLRHQPLVALILRPADVALMVVAEEHLPVKPVPVQGLASALTPVLERDMPVLRPWA